MGQIKGKFSEQFANMEMRSKLLTGFAILFIVFLLNSLINFYSLQRTDYSLNNVFQSMDHVNQIHQLNHLVTEQRVQLFAHLGYQDEVDMELLKTKILAASSHIKDSLEQIRSSFHVPAAQKPIQNLTELLEHYLQAIDQTLQLSEKMSKEAAYIKANEEDNPFYEQIREQLQNLIRISQQESSHSYEQAIFQQRQSFTSMTIFGLITLIVIISLTYIINTNTKRIVALVQYSRILAKGDLSAETKQDSHDEIGRLSNNLNTMRESLYTLVNQIGHAAMQLHSSTNEILVSSQKQVHDTANQTTSINEFSASLNEMAATSNELGRNMDSIVKIVQNATDLAEQGAASIEASLNSMDNIHQANEITAEKFNLLLEKVETIAKVLSTITSIADKTNLLSVNASIEAVKAGEFGKGFGVVASEIRRLADRTMLASEEISDMITEIQKAANASMMSMDKSTAITKDGSIKVHEAGNSIQNLIEAVQDIGPRVGEMKEATDQQSEGTMQMTQAIQQIQESAANHKMNAEKNSETANILSDMSRQHFELVEPYTSVSSAPEKSEES